jgi:hypothetical protein
MLHIQPFGGVRTAVFDNARSIKIRKLLSAEAAKRSSCLEAGLHDSVSSNNSISDPKRFVHNTADERISVTRGVVIEDKKFTPQSSEASLSTNDRSPATPSDEFIRPAGRTDKEITGCDHSLPHKLAALIAEVKPSSKYIGEHSSAAVDNVPAERRPDHDSLGVGGVEELRREIERLIKATERAAARDVELVELRAEIRSRSAPPLPETRLIFLHTSSCSRPSAHQSRSRALEIG